MLEKILAYVIPIPLDSLFDPTPQQSLVMSLWASALGLGLGLMMAWAVGYLALLVWVARDATARGMDGSVLWMLLVLFTGAAGLLIYVLARPQGRLVRCAACRGERLTAGGVASGYQLAPAA